MARVFRPQQPIRASDLLASAVRPSPQYSAKAGLPRQAYFGCEEPGLRGGRASAKKTLDGIAIGWPTGRLTLDLQGLGSLRSPQRNSPLFNQCRSSRSATIVIQLQPPMIARRWTKPVGAFCREPCASMTENTLLAIKHTTINSPVSAE